MKRLISLTIVFFIILNVYTVNAYAEYYLECYAPIPHVVYIDCKGNHCHWQTRHAANWHYDTKHHRNRNIERYCNQDMATGDDNPCTHPDLQINY